MNNQTNNSTSYEHPDVLELVQRQLAAWQILLTTLEAADAPADQQAYCSAQIERLQTDLIRLKS